MSISAVVTGGTRGIGFAIAERLISDGLDVLVTGTKKIDSGPPHSDYRCVNFKEENELEEFAEFLKYKGVDILVNNAGINKIDKFQDISPSDFDQILQVNLKAPFLLCQAVIPSMKKRNWGRIINISSIFGHVTKEYRASYSSSKFGLDGMTAAIAAELSQFNILANCIGPGFIDTELTRKVLGPEGILEMSNKIPIKRLGNASEIAALVSWLASEENTYITGQNIMIDGGFTRV